jgi:hypothetical protein
MTPLPHLTAPSQENCKQEQLDHQEKALAPEQHEEANLWWLVLAPDL